MKIKILNVFLISIILLQIIFVHAGTKNLGVTVNVIKDDSLINQSNYIEEETLSSLKNFANLKMKEKYIFTFLIIFIVIIFLIISIKRICGKNEL